MESVLLFLCNLWQMELGLYIPIDAFFIRDDVKSVLLFYGIIHLLNGSYHFALWWTRAFGYSSEDVQMVIETMAAQGKEPTFCMGDDIPLAVLSQKPHMLYDYFKQRFAQVCSKQYDSGWILLTGTFSFNWLLFGVQLFFFPLLSDFFLYDFSWCLVLSSHFWFSAGITNIAAAFHWIQYGDIDGFLQLMFKLMRMFSNFLLNG